MTPERREELLRWMEEPLPPDVQAQSDAQMARAEDLKTRAQARAQEVLTLFNTDAGAYAALSALFDVVALEAARCRVLAVPLPTMDDALAAYDLSISIDERSREVATLGMS